MIRTGRTTTSIIALAATAGLAAGAMTGCTLGDGAPGAALVGGLTIEHRSGAPLGIDVPEPRLGWQLSSSARDVEQSAYRVLVASSQALLDEGEGDLWDSGKVASEASIAIGYDGEDLAPSSAYWWTVQAWDGDDRPTGWAEPQRFETALMSTDGEANWSQAEWISLPDSDPLADGAPLFRHETELSGADLTSARLYISALGSYEAHINGRPVGVRQGDEVQQELLAPGWTNYDTMTNYMTYDVTDEVLAGSGDLVLAAVVGNGWYNGRVSRGSTYHDPAGSPVALKAKLLLEYGDGSAQTVVTTPGDGWLATDEGPYRASDIYDGQTTDARAALPGWAEPAFDDSSWTPTVENDFTERFPESRLVAYPGETARLTPEWDPPLQSVTVYDEVEGEATSPNGLGRIVVDRSRSSDDPDEAASTPVTLGEGDTAVYDLGQNIVGVPEFTVEGPEGAEIELRFGEMLNDDSGTAGDSTSGADGPEGSVYFANLRTAVATSRYILAGDGEERHRDNLSFYGFRYVQVRVVTPGAQVTMHELSGRVATSALRDTGRISTDDPQVNQLFENVRWGQRGNYLWVPTDCPQRDERQGWTGDTQLFAATALYNGDAVNFLSHFQDSSIDSQALYGADGAQYPAVVPGGWGANTPERRNRMFSGWADSGIIVPWTVWQMSGDPSIVDSSWESMTLYMDWIMERTGTTYAGQGAVYGDWLAFQPTSNQLMSDAYYAYSARLMAEMAEATGRLDAAEQYEELFENIKDAYIRKYLSTDAEGTTMIQAIGLSRDIDGERESEPDTQAALLWTLKLGLYDTERQHDDLRRTLGQNVRNDGEYTSRYPNSARAEHEPNTLGVGFLGVNVLAPVLSDEGYSDLSYELLHQNALPSWMYSVESGATTIWERWNSYSNEDGFGPTTMNSFNHYAYGAIVEWMYERMVGIARDPEHPGFKNVLLQPTLDPTGSVTEVEGSFDGPYGTIASSWSVDGERFAYSVTIPANSTAELRLPEGVALESESGVPLGDVDGVVAADRDGESVYELASGTYSFSGAIAGD